MKLMLLSILLAGLSFFNANALIINPIIDTAIAKKQIDSSLAFQILQTKMADDKVLVQSAKGQVTAYFVSLFSAIIATANMIMAAVQLVKIRDMHDAYNLGVWNIACVTGIISLFKANKKFEKKGFYNKKGHKMIGKLAWFWLANVAMFANVLFLPSLLTELKVYDKFLNFLLGP
jgi:hypothetical protein